MSTTGTKLPGTTLTAAEAPHDGVDWTNPDNIKVCDSTNATTSWMFDRDSTFVLYALNFDFSAVPDDATIDGVECTINGLYSELATTLEGDLAQLTDTDGVRTGTNNLLVAHQLSASPGEDLVLGGSKDKWGCTLTPSWIKDEDFGIGIGFYATADSQKVYIDCITLEVYYTEASGATNVISSRANESRAPRNVTRRPGPRG